jgi:hypothetical protein
VLDGQAPDALLDTYESERRPHIPALTHGAIGLGKVANMHDAEAAAARPRPGCPPRRPVDQLWTSAQDAPKKVSIE